MNKTPYVKKNLNALGKLFRELRQEKDYSIRGIAQNLNLAHSVIADLETGKTTPNIETLKQLYHQIDVDLLTDSRILTKLKEDIDLFYEAVYHKDDDYVKHSYVNISQNKQEWIHSLLSFEYRLFEETYLCYIVRDGHMDTIHFLETFQHYFSSVQKQRLNFLKGLKHLQRNELNEALSQFEDNLDLNKDKKLEAMTYSMLCTLNRKLFKNQKSMHYASVAAKLHGELANIKRKLEVELILLKNLIESMRLHDASELIYNIEIALSIQEDISSELTDNFMCLKAYHAYMQSEYHQALNLLQSFKSPDPIHSLMIARTLAKLARTDEAIATLEERLNHKRMKTSPMFSDIFTLIIYTLKSQEDQTDYEQLLLSLLDNPYQLPDYTLFHFIYEIALEYYTQRNMHAEGLKLARKMVKYFRYA